MARDFGASETINARNVDIGYLQKFGIDCVVDSSGNQAGLNLSSQIVRSSGRLNLFGWNHGTPSFPGDTWHMNGLTVVNSAPGSAIRNTWPVAIRLLERKIVDQRPLITHIAGLDEYQELLSKAASKEDGYIKGVVRVAPASVERMPTRMMGVDPKNVDVQLTR